MTQKTKKPNRAADRLAGEPKTWAPQALSPPPPTTTEARLEAIVLMEQRIHGYVEFMKQVAAMNGVSAEAKEKAVGAFHERMSVLERHLGRIHDDLRLG